MPSIKEKASRPAKPQPDPLRKLSFGAINRKANNAKTAYPVLPDPNGQLAIIAARIIERTAQIEALDGAREIDKDELKTLATPFYFTQASGKVDVASSVSALSPAGEVLITFPNRYGRLESEAALLPHSWGTNSHVLSARLCAGNRWRQTAGRKRPRTVG